MATEDKIVKITDKTDQNSFASVTQRGAKGAVAVELIGSDGSLIIDSDTGLVVTSPSLALRLDDTTTANTTYVGKAAIASTTSSASWQIFKMDETTGLVITWADGDNSFDNIWDNRASLSYS